MGDPVFKTQRNKRTGELRQLVSNDDGMSWQVLQHGPSPVESAPATEAPSPAPSEPMSSMEMFAELGKRGADAFRDNVWNPVMQGLGDAELGMAQGATWGAGDEISAMGDPQRLEEFRANNAEARARSPWLYGGGQALGAGTVGLVAGPMSTALAGAGRAAPIAEGAIQGGVTGFNEADGDITDRAMAALAGAGIGGGVGAAVPALGKAAGYAARLPDMLARRAQATAEGLTGPAFNALSKLHGVGWTRDQLAQEALDSAPFHLKPWNASEYADFRAVGREAAGPDVAAAMERLGGEVPHALSLDDFTGRMDDMAQPWANMTPKEDKAKAAALLELRDSVEQKYGGRTPIAGGGEVDEVPDVYLSPADLQSEKVAWAQRGYPKNATHSTSDADQASMYREASAIPRQALAEATALATPVTQQEVGDALNRYGAAATLADSTAKRAAAQEGRGRESLLSLLTGPMRDRSADAASLAMQGAGAGLRGVDRFAQGAEQFPMSMPGAAAGDAAGLYQQGTAAREAIAGKSQGHNLESSIEEAMQSNPQALGPYASKFAEAQQSGDPRRVTALIFELEEDPVWRTKYKPALSASNRGP